MIPVVTATGWKKWMRQLVGLLVGVYSTKVQQNAASFDRCRRKTGLPY
jgi:hypothetical protein